MGRKLQSEYPYRSTEYNRDKNLTKKYGISLKQWNKLFSFQGKVCAICGTDDPRGKNWHTDHNHETGKIRGILCGWCNTAIGKLQENPDLFDLAKIYLLVHNYKDKGGIEDLRKAIHNIEILIELEQKGGRLTDEPGKATEEGIEDGLAGSPGMYWVDLGR